MTTHKAAQTIWDYMNYQQPLEKSDVIIGLGSTDIRTAEWVAKLYHDGWAPQILFTGARGKLTRDAFTDDEADVYAERAIGLGVPAGSILRETQATNTGQNIVYGHELMKQQNVPYKSLILVTKPYMLRRAYATFMKQWPDSTKPRIICSAIDVSFDEYCRDSLYPFDYVANVMVGDL